MPRVGENFARPSGSIPQEGREMERRALLRLLFGLVLGGVAPVLAVPGGRSGLLWRVERPGAAANWLFGTLHQRTERLLPLAAPVSEAFASSRRLVVELLASPAGAARFSEAASFEGGERLDRLLPAEAFALLLARLRAEGLPAERIVQLKPWAALLLASAQPQSEAGRSLDHELFVMARMRRMPVDELDSVEEQIAVFDDLPLASQIALLQAVIDFAELLPELAQRSVDAYLARDLARLEQLGRMFEARRPALAEHRRVLEKKVIFDRSVVMAYRLQSNLRRGNTFVAVGASHLYGAAGLPAILRRDYGWRSRPVW